MRKHAVAYDPMLQDKIDELVANPNLYYLRHQLHMMENSLEENLRTKRAIERQIENSNHAVEALKMAVKAVGGEVDEY